MPPAIGILPPAFEAFAPFAESWGNCVTQEDRYWLRQHSTMTELQHFHSVVARRLDEIFTHLDLFPMDDLPAPELLLYRIALGLTEAAMAVEVFKQPGVPYAPFPHKMAIEWRG